MDVHRMEEIRADASRAKHVAHQRAPAGTEFDHSKALRPAAVLPDLHEKKPDQLSKDLADLGRGDEIAGNRIAPDIIARERIGESDAHEFRNGDRTAFADHAPDFTGAA